MSEQTDTRERISPIPGLDAEATPLLGIGLGLTGLALGLRPRLAPLPLALTALAAALYRDPRRVTPREPRVIYAPADGQVIGVDEVYEHRFVHTDCVRLAIAGSPFDVPVSRSPLAGVVRLVQHVGGEYRPTGDPLAAERNDRIYIGIDTDSGPLLLVHIAGPLARRISCRVEVGDRLEAGSRIGLARFGARTDLLVQRDLARLLVGSGQRVRAGVTPLAELSGL